MKDRWYIGYLKTDLPCTDFQDETSVEADSVSEAVEKCENIFKEKYPELKDGGYEVSVEKGMMTSNSVEADYYRCTS